LTTLVLGALDTETGVRDTFTNRAHFGAITGHKIAWVWLTNSINTHFPFIRTTEWEAPDRFTETIKTSVGCWTAHLSAGEDALTFTAETSFSTIDA